ncbi:unnamed protein product [Fraxinus pennsylvanica]|uniref:Uncharacterized protein n=1 Tax=Fraxinus pennsylvanica TaxID=56036 RepID=A0AAD1ZBK1_9LAMI|nr:unnamed protein product [Fraxinus pennsylvanica]
MDCNKEVAIRAKDITQKKIEDKNFTGARKVAMKAQHIYPDLKNISQIILVCNLHCFAETRVYGGEKDRLLMVEQFLQTVKSGCNKTINLPQQPSQQGLHNNQSNSRKFFSEYEVNSPGMPQEEPTFPQQKDATSQHQFKVGSQSAYERSTSETAAERNMSNGKAACKILPKTRDNSEGGEGSKPGVKIK